MLPTHDSEVLFKDGSQDVDASVDELQHVFVFGDDHSIEVPVSRPLHQRGYHIIGLKANRTVATSTHVLEHHRRHLHLRG